MAQKKFSHRVYLLSAGLSILNGLISFDATAGAWCEIWQGTDRVASSREPNKDLRILQIRWDTGSYGYNVITKIIGADEDRFSLCKNRDLFPQLNSHLDLYKWVKSCSVNGCEIQGTAVLGQYYWGVIKPIIDQDGILPLGPLYRVNFTPPSSDRLSMPKALIDTSGNLKPLFRQFDKNGAGILKSTTGLGIETPQKIDCEAGSREDKDTRLCIPKDDYVAGVPPSFDPESNGPYKENLGKVLEYVEQTGGGSSTGLFKRNDSGIDLKPTNFNLKYSGGKGVSRNGSSGNDSNLSGSSFGEGDGSFAGLNPSGGGGMGSSSDSASAGGLNSSSSGGFGGKSSSGFSSNSDSQRGQGGSSGGAMDALALVGKYGAGGGSGSGGGASGAGFSGSGDASTSAVGSGAGTNLMAFLGLGDGESGGGRSPSSTQEGMLSQEPADYFNLLGSDQNIFKVVHKRYQQTTPKRILGLSN